jgi:peroxiredoxin
MIINVETTEDKYFRQALELLKPLPPFNKLRPKVLDILAQLLYFNNKYKHIEKVIRFKILFDYETKVLMRNNVNMDEASFNNILSELRRVNIIDKKGLVSDFGIDPDKDSGNIIFKFKIDGKI